MQPLPPFAALRAFDLVGQTGGIRKAAKAMGLSHAIVSRHLAALEDMLGTVLLDRRTGLLTESGAAYHAEIHAAIDQIAKATDTLRESRGERLVISCAAGFALHWLTHHLPDFASRRMGTGSSAPRPVIELRASDQLSGFGDVDVDGDIRYRFEWDRSPVSPDIRTQVLVRPQVFPVAAPALLSRFLFGDCPLSLADLQTLPLIEESSPDEWRVWFAAQGMAGHLPRPSARFGQAHLTIAAARAGQGVALSNRYLCAEDLAAGRLVRLIPHDAPSPQVELGAYVFRCARSRWADPLLARFRTWLGDLLCEEQIGSENPLVPFPSAQ